MSDPEPEHDGHSGEPVQSLPATPPGPVEPTASPLEGWAPSSVRPTAVDGASGSSTKLWWPRDVGVVAFLFGFPAGLGLAARNWFRLGRRRKAYAHLVAGAAALLLITLLPSGGTSVAGALSLGIAIYLYLQTRTDNEKLVLSGRVVERAGTLSGIATSLGAWALLLVPSIVVAFVLVFVGPRGIPTGTVAFGTGGSGCEVTGVATTFGTDRPIHLAANFSREVKAGELVRETISEAATGVLNTDDVTIDAASNCGSRSIPAGILPAGAYTWEYAVGNERLARGEVVITAPTSS